jgi:hypothetical protein
MWAAKNRGRYDRGKLRSLSDLTDAEWKLVAVLASYITPKAIAASSGFVAWMLVSEDCPVR